MAKLLVNSPSGEQKLIPIDDSGWYFDETRVEWDTRVDGDLPEDIELGKMVREGNQLIKQAEFLTEHAAFVRSQLVPISVTKRQARLALLEAGLLSAVDSFVGAQSQEVQIYWNDSQEIYRRHPLILSLSAELNLSESQVDDLFISAGGK